MRALRNGLIIALVGALVALVMMLCLSRTSTFQEKVAQQDAEVAAQKEAEEHAEFVSETIAPYADGTVIFPNVWIGDVAVGDMNYQDAISAVETAMQNEYSRMLNVHLPDRDLNFHNVLNNLEQDATNAVYEALSYGREDLDQEAFCEAILSAQSTEKHIDFSTASSCDKADIQSTVQAAADAIYTAPTETTVSVDEDSQTITVTKGACGQELDVDALVEEITDAFAEEDYQDITCEYDAIEPDTVDIASVMDEYCYPAEDASYDKESDSIIDSQSGYECDYTTEEAEKSIDALDSGEVLTMTYTEVQPEITTENLESVLFRDTLYSYGSVYASNADRTTNLKLACAEINGTILLPGEVFSFNDVVGERTTEKGYKNAIVYVDKKSESQAGGGVCQVASTIYYCCLYAELEIVQREPHMYKVTYVPNGMDATVYWGSVDFQFRNSTDYPMKVNAYLSGGRCWIELIGTDVDDHVVKMESYATDKTKLNYQVNRYVYDSTGTTLIREDNIGVSTYLAHKS